ncbi:uncharacterized protein [Pyrus communis]|uniref:uncharacterized protein n=1 Tax=Pyrus communis TaxID=23211 RepID=UPI0035C0B1AE
MVLGDFNEILCAEEQEGGDIQSERQMQGFRNALTNYQLQDLGYVGNKFTWVTTRCGGIKVRLDRVVASQKWMDVFPGFRVSHLKPNSSDHIPIMVEWMPKNKARFKKTFQYEEGWSMEEGCVVAVQQGWATEFHGSPMFQVTEKIKATQLQLANWAKTMKRSIPREISETEDKLNALFGRPFTKTTIAQRHELNTWLQSLLAQEEAFWRQRSKENWLKLGDQNTKKFHQKANRRQRMNALSRLYDEAGV